MKRYGLFIVSLFVLYLLFELSSGLLLTVFYTPDLLGNTTGLQQSVSLGGAKFPFLMTVVTASIAYFIAQKAFRKKNLSN